MNIKSKIMTKEWFLEDLLPKNCRYFANLFLKLLIFSGAFKKIFFNWRIIALQNFVVFCHTSARISHRYTHIVSPPDPAPISLPTPPFSLLRAPVWVPHIIQQILFYTCYCKFLCYSLHTSPLSLLSSHPVHRSVLHVCFSIAALQINSSVSSF